MLSLADYESLQETAYLLRSPANAKRLLASMENLNAGKNIQKGIKDLQEVYEKFSDEIVDIFNETHSDFEHCVCPEGFYGIRCEYEVEECSETHVCFHGSTCRETASGSSCVCEDSDHLTAGLFCEFFATEDCDESLAPSPSDYRGFCTNGGLCVVTDG
jgi:hypothetical protein